MAQPWSPESGVRRLSQRDLIELQIHRTRESPLCLQCSPSSTLQQLSGFRPSRDFDVFAMTVCVRDLLSKRRMSALGVHRYRSLYSQRRADFFQTGDSRELLVFLQQKDGRRSPNYQFNPFR